MCVGVGEEKLEEGRPGMCENRDGVQEKKLEEGRPDKGVDSH